MRTRGRLAVAVLGACLLAGVPGGGRTEAGEGRAEKLRRLVGKLEYPQRFRALVRAELERTLGGDAGKVEAALGRVKWEPFLDLAAEEIGRGLDDATLDEVLPYLDTAEGRRHLVLLRLDRSRQALDLVIALGDPGGRLPEMGTRLRELTREAARGPSPEGYRRPGPSETSAIATLRNLASCQAQISTSGKIDCDDDGIGEYGTFLEMTGSVGVRRHREKGEGAFGSEGCDFSEKGGTVRPPVLSPALAGVDADGIVTKAGYCFRIFLPDTAPRAGFTHETGPGPSVGLAGGTGRVSVDLAESHWCAYAWPEARGEGGDRAFFVDESGDVLVSSNEVARWSGAGKAPPGDSAFLRGAGITGRVAVGTRGSDGDVWKMAD